MNEAPRSAPAESPTPHGKHRSPRRRWAPAAALIVTVTVVIAVLIGIAVAAAVRYRLDHQSHSVPHTTTQSLDVALPAQPATHLHAPATCAGPPLAAAGVQDLMVRPAPGGLSYWLNYRPMSGASDGQDWIDRYVPDRQMVATGTRYEWSISPAFRIIRASYAYVDAAGLRCRGGAMFQETSDVVVAGGLPTELSVVLPPGAHGTWFDIQVR